MQLYSTNSPSKLVSLREALFKGLPEDNGLYMPKSLPKLPEDFIKNIEQYSFQEIAFEVAHAIIQNAVPVVDLHEIINKALYFPAPLVELSENTFILELFHGPSLAFKDFGARFMAQLMRFFLEKEEQKLIILVATSGDTGAAVAAGFHNTENTEVVILYPSGKVSKIQEKQLTTFGNNIHALEIKGTFDDCQKLVKQAFLDKGLTSTVRISSANSINIARLIPQSFYYFEAFKQIPDKSKKNIFSIPSGNFGNLTAGLFAKKLGLPIHHFIAAVNQNSVIPEYLRTGLFIPRPSTRTLSNAMDVGNPSNFARMKDLYCSTWNNLKKDVSAYSISEKETMNTLSKVHQSENYLLDPHAAVGLKAYNKYKAEKIDTYNGIILGTAHPAKFTSEIHSFAPDITITYPRVLKEVQEKQKEALLMDAEFSRLKEYILEKFKHT